jgi:hypothetical protein
VMRCSAISDVGLTKSTCWGIRGPHHERGGV